MLSERLSIDKAACLFFGALLFPIIAVANPEGSEQNSMPPAWGHIVIQNQGGCADIAGQYYLIGTVVPETTGFAGTLNYILRVPLPTAAYQPNVEKFAVFGIVKNQRIEVTVVLGGAARSSLKEVKCEDGWLRFNEKGMDRAEGNSVEYYTTSLLAKNQDGDLVAQYAEATNSSTLFGLLRSKSVGRYWVLFRKRPAVP